MKKNNKKTEIRTKTQDRLRLIIKKFESVEEWKNARIGKITGTRLKDIVVLRGTEEKKGFYQLIAERLATPRPEGEDKMERGHELEVEAIELCEKEIGKKFNKDLVLWMRGDDNSIAISPDGFTEDLKEAAEVKCLSSADHIEAVLKNQYPDEYKFQVLQYFIVNEELKVLHFIMYDPSLSVHQYIRFEIKREDIKDEIEKYKEYERQKLELVKKAVIQLSF